MENITLNKQLLESVYKMVSSMMVLTVNERLPELAFVLKHVGIEEQEMEDVTAFIQRMWSPEDLDILTVQQAKLTYLDAFRDVVKLKRHVEMAKGYEEMGDINLGIANDAFEDEGEKAVNEEVDSTEGKDTTEKE